MKVKPFVLADRFVRNKKLEFQVIPVIDSFITDTRYCYLAQLKIKVGSFPVAD